ncbi:hypothetical protein IMCC3317_03280 [Kordia antarctica]|uniref:Uncharacterized protein n=1 Tax=Kordia antarctica TaxID=1218801 RepID=A0A7L4ZDX6_9FLAO|nr:hypothetical protein [Kordia antarctica]QHI34982.1 hypothetical protein IMCC3317_03280 [Kordia antarctica]
MKKVRNLMRILCILLLFLFTNCQHDTVIETQQEETLQNKFSLKSSVLSMQEAEANIKLSNKMRSLTTLQSSNIAENVYSEAYNFTIDTYVVKLVESTENDSHSYTFPISRENNVGSVLENLVFSYNTTTDDYDASLVTYHFNASQKQEFLTSKHVSTPYGITNEPIAVNLADILGETVTPCTTNYTEYHTTPDTGQTFVHSSSIGNVNNECEHEDISGDIGCTVYTIITSDCAVSGSSGSSSGSPSSTPTGGGNDDTTDTTTPTDDEDNIITSPITREESIKQSITDCINGVAEFNTTDTTTIDVQILEQLGYTINDWITINNYLNDNGCSETAQEDVIEDLLDAYDDYQILNELQGKALCVYNKLKSSSSGFKNAIKKFDGDFPVAHLKFEALILTGTKKGRTVAPSNGTSPDANSPDYVISIQLNSSQNIYGYHQRPNLLIAKTIIHEVIHAEMYRKLLSLAQQGHLDFTGLTAEQQTNLVLSIQNNFPGLYDYMRRHNNWQHQQMATHYRETIARALQEFDTGVAVPETQQPLQLYMDLSWEGLIYENGNNAISSWISLSQTERDRIELVISNYIANNINEICTP